MKNRITGKQLESTIALFFIGSSLITGAPAAAHQDTWVCLVLAFFLSIPLLWIHSQIIELYPGRNYFENIITACSKPVGKGMCILLILYSFYIAAFVMRIFCRFIQVLNMPETPFIFILLSIVIIEFYVSKKRINVVARISSVMFPLLALTVFLTVILGYDTLDFSNLKPFLQSSFTPMAETTFLFFMLPFGESILCAPLFVALDQTEKVFPVFLKGTLLGFSLLLLANLRNLLTLGYATNIFPFPSYEAVSVIAIGDYFTRIEVIIGFNLLLAGFIKVCVTYFTCCQVVTKLLNFDDYVHLFAPCGLILVTLIMIFSSNTEEMIGFLKYFPFFALPFQVIIPLAVLTMGKIKRRTKIGRLNS